MILSKRRRGLAVPEWCCILGLIGIGLIWSVGRLGVATQEKLNTTASDVVNPQNPVGRFSGDSGGSASGDSNPGNKGGAKK